MAVADYVTKEDLEEALKTLVTTTELLAMEARMIEACAKHSKEQADRTIEAIQRGTSSSF